MDRGVRDIEDVLRLMDGLFASEADRWTQAGGSEWWDGFYADRGRPIPFFSDRPDENLVEWRERGLIGPGRVLELGCGPGRNAVYLASAGFEVDAVDLSPAALEWARERAEKAGVGDRIRWHHGDIFRLTAAGTGPLSGPYDVVYDSGCFHHLPPHRRVSYRELLGRVLRPGGSFGLTCFASGAMGSELPDEAFYRDARLHGGLAYTPESLRWIFADLTEVELRRMRKQPQDAPSFGEDFLWALLMRREPEGAEE